MIAREWAVMSLIMRDDVEPAPPKPPDILAPPGARAVDWCHAVGTSLGKLRDCPSLTASELYNGCPVIQTLDADCHLRHSGLQSLPPGNAQ